MLNGSLWDQAKFTEQWKKGEKQLLAQSRGKAPMVALPARGDQVVFVLKGKIVMRGCLISDGFVRGTAHQNDSNNLGDQRTHAEHEEFAWILINNISEEPQSVPRTGQRTWLKVPKNDIWS